MPELSAAGEAITTPKRAQILPHLKTYLQPFTNENAPTDLLDFWKSAIHFYSQIIESRTLGHDLIQVNYDLKTGVVGHAAGPFTT